MFWFVVIKSTTSVLVLCPSTKWFISLLGNWLIKKKNPPSSVHTKKDEASLSLIESISGKLGWSLINSILKSESSWWVLDKEFWANYLVPGKPLNFNHGSTSVSLETERTVGSTGKFCESLCFSGSPSAMLLLARHGLPLEIL